MREPKIFRFFFCHECTNYFIIHCYFMREFVAIKIVSQIMRIKQIFLEP